jgi:hypothetical protein
MMVIRTSIVAAKSGWICDTFKKYIIILIVGLNVEHGKWWQSIW